MKTGAILSLLLLVCGFAFAGGPKEVPPTFAPLTTVEAWRIRIVNTLDGPIEVSTNQGQTWRLIGRVINPATRSLQGYLASGYAAIGSVAATAVHGIRIRVGDTSTAYPDLINIIPLQFAVTPVYYGGHIAGTSGIYTDIPAGVSLFRELAPTVGTQTYLQIGNGSLTPLVTGYSPQIGDVLILPVRRPINPLRELDLENKVGGAVTATFADGTVEIVTTVCRPVQGTGRFDGTSYTGVGAINTNHTCVITVSTAPVTTSTQLEGVGPERRGGFQIEPAYHNSQTEEASAPQVMILGTFKAKQPSLEGTPPLFFGYFTLAWSGDNLTDSWICDIKTRADPAHWQQMPELIGTIPDAFVKRGVIAFRLHQSAGDDDPAVLAKWVENGAAAYALTGEQLARSGKMSIARGNLPVQVQLQRSPSYVELFIDGSFNAVTNSPPFSFDWDSGSVPDGEHLVEARAVDESGNVVSSLHQLIWVDNAHKLPG